MKMSLQTSNELLYYLAVGALIVITMKGFVG